MKRMLVVAAAVLLPASGFAATCKPVAEFRVGFTAYKARSPEKALERMLRGTPYKGIVEGANAAPERTRRLAGPLTLTLDRFAGQFGLSWEQDGCQLKFVPQSARQALSHPSVDVTRAAINPISVQAQSAPVVQGATAWALQPDTPIHLQFADWARLAGWTFEWRLQKSWLVPAATQFTGTFDEALAQAVEALHAQGKPVRLILWEGNRFAEIVDVDAR